MRDALKYTIRIPQIPSAPKHLREDHGRRFLLLRWANFVAGYYGVPVYLVGSALRDDNPDPRDWDIRIRLGNEAFKLAFGDPHDYNARLDSGFWGKVNWHWSRECVKRADEGQRHTHLFIDFQIETAKGWRKSAGKPRLRLDHRLTQAAAACS